MAANPFIYDYFITSETITFISGGDGLIDLIVSPGRGRYGGILNDIEVNDNLSALYNDKVIFSASNINVKITRKI